jgi:hypothetical protein
MPPSAVETIPWRQPELSERYRNLWFEVIECPIAEKDFPMFAVGKRMSISDFRYIDLSHYHLHVLIKQTLFMEMELCHIRYSQTNIARSERLID